MEQCPVCRYSYLHVDDEDSRQEWNRIYYHCPRCKNEFTRKITYQCQSSLVQSDEWEYTEEEIEKIHDEWEKRRKSESKESKDLDTIEHCATVLTQLLKQRELGLFSWYESIRGQMKVLHDIYHRSGMGE